MHSCETLALVRRKVRSAGCPLSCLVVLQDFIFGAPLLMSEDSDNWARGEGEKGRQQATERESGVASSKRGGGGREHKRRTLIETTKQSLN